MRRTVAIVGAIVVTLALLAIGAIAAVRFERLVWELAPWLKFALPLVLVAAGLPSIVRRVRTRKFPLVEF